MAELGLRGLIALIALQGTAARALQPQLQDHKRTTLEAAAVVGILHCPQRRVQAGLAEAGLALVAAPVRLVVQIPEAAQGAGLVVLAVVRLAVPA